MNYFSKNSIFKQSLQCEKGQGHLYLIIMGISASIQKFVDGLDINSKSYFLLLFIQAVLMVATIYVKKEVAANHLHTNRTEINRIIQPDNSMFKIFKAEFFK